MALRAALLVLLFVWCLSSSLYGVEGRRLSKEEDLELEKQLKLLNKPAIKTIRTRYGDMYDCVDFYKQPAFDHPALKNHTFHYQMKPTSYPKWRRNQASSRAYNLSNIWLNGKGCPVGTVPIRRTTKDDLIRAKLAAEIHALKLNPLTAEKPGLHLAVARTISRLNKKYYGAGMFTSYYNLPVKGSQYTSGQMKIQNGGDLIQVGWTVNPTLYNDNRTRSFMFTSMGSSSCFNTYCGFVIESTAIPIDVVFDTVSKVGGPTYDMEYFVYKDKANGNWFLNLGHDSTEVGYWPQKLFTGLADAATYIEWGGEVNGPPDVPSPPMGSGEFIPLYEDTRKDAYCGQIQYIDEDYKNLAAPDVEEFADIDTYEVKDEGNVGGYFGHLILFGGGGNHIGN